MLMRYFRKEENGWRISEAIRGMVQYREWNPLSDLRPLEQFDVVFCRNVLIYFDQPTKSKVLDALARQMPADGLLYLGGAETVLGITTRFAALPAERESMGWPAWRSGRNSRQSRRGRGLWRDFVSEALRKPAGCA
jgi:chemotaxis protein methyltransferase CheR